MSLFEHFPKIPRAANLQCRITEKIDGTNAQIYIPGEGPPNPIGFLVGSRNRWINPDADNYGFARWAYENAAMLLRLGPGRHYGEWWGAGIQRGYGLAEKRFSLFDAFRWTPERLAERELTGLVSAVPILATCNISELSYEMGQVANFLATEGSRAAPGYLTPEGFVVQIGEARFKVTDGGNRPKWQNGVTNLENYKPGVLWGEPLGAAGNKFRQTADEIPSQEVIGRVQVEY